MGDPRKIKKKYEVPKKAWEKDRIVKEREIMKKYGLHRKKELRIDETILRNLKRRARGLITKTDQEKKKILIDKAFVLGIVNKDASLDDILKLEIENLLERRLQTILFKKKMANTTYQARQFITHGHILVNKQKVCSPGYIVTRDMEDKIEFNTSSTLKTSFKFIEKKDETKKDVAPKAEEKPAEAIEEKVEKVITDGV